jgi:hypothetical protein
MFTLYKTTARVNYYLQSNKTSAFDIEKEKQIIKGHIAIQQRHMRVIRPITNESSRINFLIVKA